MTCSAPRRSGPGPGAAGRPARGRRRLVRLASEPRSTGTALRTSPPAPSRGSRPSTAGTYRRTIVVDGYRACSSWAPAATTTWFVAHLPHWEGLVHVVERARRISASTSTSPRRPDHLGRRPGVGPLLDARPGLRVPGAWDPFETGCGRSSGSRSRWPERHDRRAGSSSVRPPVPGLMALGLAHTFPTAPSWPPPTSTASASRPRRPRSTFAAAVVRRGRLDGSVGLDELVPSIRALAGSDPGRPTTSRCAWASVTPSPPATSALRRALPRRAPRTAAALGDLAERWRPWRALAATHLWIADGLREPVHSTAQGAA